ncbi:MAG: glycerate kinase [Bacteroidales bacterium]|nr:glycerate kinase [Bacteroidales bacterium]
MKVFVAIDSFKGSLSTFEANEAVREALAEINPDLEVRCFPMSDGGEGFSEVYTCYAEASKIDLKAHSPLGDIIDTHYYLTADGTAIIESALICGYTLVPYSKKDPLNLTTFGLGEIMADAISRGAKRMVIGLGGTSTCDGGVGMLQALGAMFYLKNRLLSPGEPALMNRIEKVDLSALKSIDCAVSVWVDTDASFYGEKGAVKVFGRQKGIKPEYMDAADQWMKRLWSLYGRGESFVPGTGAAGGLGGALSLLSDSETVSGAQSILAVSRFKELVDGEATAPDYVITGEGKFDSQSLTGKLPYAVALSAPKAKVICLAGKAEILSDIHFERIVQITPDDMPLSKALDKEVAAENIRTSLRNITFAQ